MFYSSSVRPKRTSPAVAPTGAPANSPWMPKAAARPPRRGTFITPPLGQETKLRIIPLGGMEEVGRNMVVFEYGRDIVIVDMGLQFPEEDMPGIDYIIPNISYLKGKEKNIRGVILTHGHLDHIGAAPLLLEKLGYPPIIGRDLTLALVKRKQDDYAHGTVNRIKTIRVASLNDTMRLGAFTVKFFQVEHSIMDAMGVILETPAGVAIHPGDWTMERDRAGHALINYTNLQRLRRPTALLLESLGSTNEQSSGSYEDMYRNLQNTLANAPGRVIIGTFSSQIERVRWVLEAAQNLNKKVALDGFSMKTNIEIAQELGYIKVKRGTLIDVRKIDDYPPQQVVVVCTGAQGESNAVLMRIVNGDHGQIKLRKEDTVIFSSSVIPGNERSIQRLKDSIYRQCDHVLHGELMDVHVSGHATRADIVEMLRQIKPDYFIPVYANHYFLKEAAILAKEHGFPAQKIIVPDNGSVIELGKSGIKMLEKKVPANYVFVDGLGVSDAQNVVLRDRRMMAEDGMFVIIATIEKRTGRLIGNPDIISRGFVYLKENKELIEKTRQRAKKLLHDSDAKSPAFEDYIKSKIRNDIGQFLYMHTKKRPLVLPVIIEV